jgi:hypothetical protein
VHVHAFHGPAGSTVWVRDASLSSLAQREALLREIRARLAANGLTLRDLVVNGEGVEVDAPPRPEQD